MNILILSTIVECLIIASVALSSLFSSVGFAVFYNIGYGLVLSTAFPIYYMLKNREDFSSVGVKRVGVRQNIILVSFVAFSVGGQVIPKIIAGDPIAWGLFPLCALPLVMTTFFEEFLFRGFFQTRIEKRYGSFVAILVSAALFSLYHLGYPGFRTLEDLLLLFAVGAGFAIAYTLSGNNLIVSYFVNLPNAIMTYIFKSSQFPVLTEVSTIYAAISIVGIEVLLIYAKNRMLNNSESGARL